MFFNVSREMHRKKSIERNISSVNIYILNVTLIDKAF